jgi:hypothetical protein
VRFFADPFDLLTLLLAFFAGAFGLAFLAGMSFHLLQKLSNVCRHMEGPFWSANFGRQAGLL